MLCDGLNNERQYEVYRPLARLYFMKKYLRWSSKVFFFPPAAPFLSCNLSQFRKSEKWKIFPLPTADTWLPPIGLRGWLDGEKSPFPSPVISSLSPSTPWAPSVPPFLGPDCPARLASWAMAGPSHPAFPPGLARTPRPHPYPRVFYF